MSNVQNTQEVKAVLTATQRAAKALTETQATVGKAVETSTSTLEKSLNKLVVDTTKKITGAMGELESLVATHEELSYKIEVAREDLAGLQEDKATKEREAQAELKIRILENERQVLVELMRKAGLAQITSEDLRALQTELDTAKADNAETVNKAVNAVKRELTSQNQAAISELKANQSVETAEYKAKIAQSESQISFLTQQVTALQDTITAEREARVATAKHSQPIIQQATPSQR